MPTPLELARARVAAKTGRPPAPAVEPKSFWQDVKANGYKDRHGNPFGGKGRRWGQSVVGTVVDVRTDGDGGAEMVLVRWRSDDGELQEVWRGPDQTRPVEAKASLAQVLEKPGALFDPRD